MGFDTIEISLVLDIKAFGVTDSHSRRAHLLGERFKFHDWEKARHILRCLSSNLASSSIQVHMPRNANVSFFPDPWFQIFRNYEFVQNNIAYTKAPQN